MHATRVLNVLVVALSTFSAVQAIKIDPNHQTYHGGHARDLAKTDDSGDSKGQTQGTGSDASSSSSPDSSSSQLPSSSSQPTSSKSESSVSTTPASSTPQSSDTPTSSTPSSTPSSSSAPSSTSSPPTSSSTTSPSPTSFSSTSPSSSPKLVTSTRTMVVTTTGANGQSTTYTSEQVSTTTPDLASANSSGSTGMTPQTRNTVIGVVVGVGGAIVLAGIAFLALRLYRRKQPEESDGLMDYNNGLVGADKAEVASSTSGRTPFQSTLESYHAPTQVNTASNF